MAAPAAHHDRLHLVKNECSDLHEAIFRVALTVLTITSIIETIFNLALSSSPMDSIDVLKIKILNLVSWYSFQLENSEGLKKHIENEKISSS